MKDVNRVPLAWREAGQGEVLLFLHGLGLTRTGWDPQLTDLSDRWRCVAWDMPGYRVSLPVEPLTFEVIADAAAGLLDVLEVHMHVVTTLLVGQIADDMDLTARERSGLNERRAKLRRGIVEDGMIHSQPFSEGIAVGTTEGFATRAVPVDVDIG